MQLNPAKLARPTHADGRRYVPAIDGLRCLAAFGVITAHIGSQTVDGHGPSHRLVAYYGSAAYPSLIVFFMISGFLVYRPFVRSMLAPRSKVATAEDRSTNFGIYILRRVLRIFPLYWTVLAATVLLQPHSNLHGLTDWVQAIFLLPFPHLTHLLAGPLGIAMWTLAIELPFYVVLPIYAAGVRAARRRWFPHDDPFHVQLGAIAIVLSVLVGCALVFGGELAFPIMSLPAGMLLAVLETRQSLIRRRYRPIRFLAENWWLCLVAYVALVFLGAHLALDAFNRPGVSDPFAAIRTAYFPIEMVQALLLVIPAAFALRRSRYVKLLSSTPLQLLAPLTYGIYLWHPLVIRYTPGWYGPGFLGFPIPGTHGFGLPTITMAIGLAIVTFVVIELPAVRLRSAVDRWSRGAGGRPGRPAARGAAAGARPAERPSAAGRHRTGAAPSAGQEQRPRSRPAEAGSRPTSKSTRSAPAPAARSAGVVTAPTTKGGRRRPATTGSGDGNGDGNGDGPAPAPWCQPIDGFRAICACLAVTGHTFLAAGMFGTSAPLAVLGILVALFFAISGYVLYQPFLEADVRGLPRPSAVGFYVRRLLRIYPLFALALTAYLVVLPEVRPANLWGYARLYLFLQIFGRELSALKGLPSAWYLCNEVIFYLAMPLLAFGAARWSTRHRVRRPEDRLRAHLAIGWGLVLVGPVTRSLLYVFNVPQPTSLPLAHLEFFGFGLVTAGYAVGTRLGIPLPRPIAWLRDNTAAAYALVLVPVATLVLISIVFADPRHNGLWADASRQDQLRFFPYLAAIILLMTAATLGRPTDPSNRWLSSRWFKPLSALALHIYLWHQLVLGVMNKLFTGHGGIGGVQIGPPAVTDVALVACALAGSILVSWLSQPITDLPYQRYRARHGHLRDSGRAPARSSVPAPRPPRPRPTDAEVIGP